MSKNSPTKTKSAKSRPPNLDIIKEDALPTIGGGSPSKGRSSRHTNYSPEGKIPRNVNFYRHLISDKYSSENDVEWMLKLRSPSNYKQNQKLEQTVTQPFSFDGTGIESQKDGRSASDMDNQNQLHKAHHLFMHRVGHTPTKGSVVFETGLRSYGSASDKLKELEKKWRNEPKKDRNEYPRMYPSYEQTTHIKSWTTKNLSIQTHSGMDGYQSLPKYGEQYARQTKNVAVVQNVLRTPGQKMSVADWQLSMRHYGDSTKPREFTEHMELRKTLGDLKKITSTPNKGLNTEN